MSALDFTSMLSMLQNNFDTKLAVDMARAKEAQQREGRGMPDSTRRAFLSRMKVDSRVAQQGAQNMGDASTMLTVAQTGITAIKHSIGEMHKIASEAKSKSSLTAEEAASYTEQLQTYAKYIKETAESTEFNGFKLLDGSKEEFELQAGGMQIIVDMANMLNSDAISDSTTTTPNKKVTNGKDINLNNLNDSVGITGADSATRMTDVQRIIDMLDGVLELTTRIESNYSYDIQGVNNFATLLKSQSDIFDAVIKNHTDSDAPAPPSTSASYLDSLVNGSYSNGNIISETS